jgi:hypothetical protein
MAGFLGVGGAAQNGFEEALSRYAMTVALYSGFEPRKQFDNRVTGPY